MLYLKKATRERDRSSRIVREEANIERRTAGVTGMRLEDLGGGYWPAPLSLLSLALRGVIVGVEDEDVVEYGIVLLAYVVVEGEE